jgi:hypothetical protein
MVSAFLFPRRVDFVGGSGRGEEPSGEVILRLIRDLFDTPSLGEFTQTSQENSSQRQIAASSSRNAVSFSSERATKRFPFRGARLQSRSFADHAAYSMKKRSATS